MSRCKACNKELLGAEQYMTKDDGNPEDMCMECLQWVGMEDVGMENIEYDEDKDEKD